MDDTWQQTKQGLSVCDHISQISAAESNQGQTMEVVEHILHHVTDVGLHYTFPEQWGLRKGTPAQPPQPGP